ncbi:MAG: carboxylating nicotinate-nucleotide diphosphorylase [Bacteroidetes bacterium]|nr:carboxylating nicotinate-nucleotide diphosphorylase [Bacteroidota bacterium]
MNVSHYRSQIDHIIDLAIAEDIKDPLNIIAKGDHSALACFPKSKQTRARLICKADGVLAGVELAQWVAHKIDPSLRFEVFLYDRTEIKKGDIAFHIHGEERSILQAERLILNFMQRMSGIATNTARYVKAVEGTRTRILDTRKTTPALRAIEKWAVQIGGGVNYRYGLYDMIMLKDNHVDFCGGVSQAILATKKYREEKGLDLRVTIETRTLDEIREVLNTGHVNRIMFDNFTPEMVREAVALVGYRYETEVSGGITLDTIQEYAKAGPDFISVGAITHSSGSLDLSLKSF